MHVLVLVLLCLPDGDVLMDPDECLRRIRAAITELQSSEPHTRNQINRATDDLYFGFQDLDEWLSKGGAMPTSWR